MMPDGFFPAAGSPGDGRHLAGRKPTDDNASETQSVINKSVEQMFKGGPGTRKIHGRA